jgi:CRP/FNR family transcriptional regulator
MISKTAAPASRADGPEAFTPSAEVRAGMDSLAPGKVLARGTVLFRQGEPARGVWVLHRGRARLTMRTDDGKAIPYRTVRAGYVLGLPGVILNIPYLFTAELVERSEVAFIERAEMLHFLRQRADLCFDVVQQLGGELIDMKIGPIPAARRRALRSNA